MNILASCIRGNRFRKDCCLVLCNNCIIVEHDGCIANSGCDLIAYDNHRFFLIEIKSGNISSSDADKIVQQIKDCEYYYSQYIMHRKKIRLFLWCRDRRKRLDDQARVKLTNNRIRVEYCQGSFDLSNLD